MIDRPKKNSPEIVKMAAQEIYPKVKQWLIDSGDEVSEEDASEIIQEIESLFEFTTNKDGYSCAKELDSRYGYIADSQLVEIFDDIDIIFDRCYKSILKKWIEENNIAPKYKIGDKVKIEHLKKEYHGEIVTIYQNSARYSIFVEELGHVKKGFGTLGVIKNYEEVNSLTD